MSRSIVLAIDTTASREEVYRALTTVDGLRSFWTSDADADAREGGSLRFGFEEAPVDLSMTVGTLAEGMSVGWTSIGPWPGWVGTEIAWTISDGAKGGDIVFAHTGWADETSDADLGVVALTWARVLLALKAYVESGDPASALG